MTLSSSGSCDLYRQRLGALPDGLEEGIEHFCSPVIERDLFDSCVWCATGIEFRWMGRI